MSAQRLSQVVELDHRQKVAAAAAADARHRPRDELVRVLVVQPFRVSGREVQSGEIVEIEEWLMSGLIATGHVTTEI
jgi:hypothetical protein